MNASQPIVLQKNIWVWYGANRLTLMSKINNPNVILYCFVTGKTMLQKHTNAMIAMHVTTQCDVIKIREWWHKNTFNPFHPLAHVIHDYGIYTQKGKKKETHGWMLLFLCAQICVCACVCIYIHSPKSNYLYTIYSHMKSQVHFF